jgi:hypothetical protein
MVELATVSPGSMKLASCRITSGLARKNVKAIATHAT